LNEALRLLRPGGAVILHGSLAGGRIGDPSQRDPATVALRETARAIADDERLVPLLLPLGDGLQTAVLAG
ncbi:MAG: methyltransferase, partial [Mycobacteriaceae bacterium]